MSTSLLLYLQILRKLNEYRLCTRAELGSLVIRTLLERGLPICPVLGNSSERLLFVHLPNLPRSCASFLVHAVVYIVWALRISLQHLHYYIIVNTYTITALTLLHYSMINDKSLLRDKIDIQIVHKSLKLYTA